MIMLLSLALNAAAQQTAAVVAEASSTLAQKDAQIADLRIQSQSTSDRLQAELRHLQERLDQEREARQIQDMRLNTTSKETCHTGELLNMFSFSSSLYI